MGPNLGGKMKEGQRGPRTTTLVEETLMNLIGML
jgi:hypothetical protein